MNKYLFLLLGITCIGFTNLSAQNWVNGGNSLAANGTLGTNSSHSLLFETSGLERGRITNGGNWAIGSTGTTSKFTVNSATSVSPFRAQIAGITKLIVNGNGGVSIGSVTVGPANGLFVAGNVGIGTAAPENRLHVYRGSAGSVTGYPLAGLIVENSTASYMNLLAPDNTETGIFFGKPQSNISGGIIYSHFQTPNGLQFRTNGNSIKMVLTNAGNVGIGTTTPGNYKLKVTQDIGFGINLENSVNSNDWEFSVLSDLMLWFNGSFRGSFNSTTGVYSATSDERLKTNIKAMPTVLEKVRQLKPATYHFKNATNAIEGNAPEQYGFLAQEVEQIFPHLVTHHVIPERGLDAYTLDYSGFGVVAIKAIQELQQPMQQQQQQIEQQQRHIELQQQQINEQQKRIEKLEQLIYKLSSGLDFNTFLSSTQLGEVSPNPVKGTATIHYAIPEGSTRTHLLITDALGRQIKALQLSASGVIHIDVSTLASGMYNYSLIVDNKTVVTRKMTVVK